MRSSDHEYDLLNFVDFVEEAPGSNPVAPSFRGVVFQLPHIRTVEGIDPKLRVHNSAKLSRHRLMSASGNLSKVLRELVGLENAVFTQRNSLASAWHLENRPAGFSRGVRSPRFPPFHRRPRTAARGFSAEPLSRSGLTEVSAPLSPPCEIPHKLHLPDVTLLF